MEIIKYDVWAEMLLDMIIGERELIQKYYELIRNRANPSRETEYMNRIEEIKPILMHNLDIYLTAEIERDYMIFYIDKGVPGYIMANRMAAREIYGKQAMLDRMVV